MAHLGKEEILEFYKGMIDFWADFLGSDTEIVLHDIENLDRSIVYIKNNFSGRQIGGPITDLGLKIIKERKYHDKDYFVNYISKTSTGKILRSSTKFIKDGDGKLVAMMCVNIDVTKYKEFEDHLNFLIRGERKSLEEKPGEGLGKDNHKNHVEETLNTSVEDVVRNMVNDVMSSSIVPVERMTNDEKYDIISQLNEKGIFLLKGSVKEIASKLKVSETTVYRYIASH